MTIKLNIPSPRSVQSTVKLEAKNDTSFTLPPDDTYSFRLHTADGKLFAQIGGLDAIALFPAAFNAFVASGKDRLNLHDIPESLLNDVVAALRSAGWYTKFCSYADPSLANAYVAIPYTPVSYFVVPHLIWSSTPFPPTFEEKLWKWLKSWFV